MKANVFPMYIPFWVEVELSYTVHSWFHLFLVPPLLFSFDLLLTKQQKSGGTSRTSQNELMLHIIKKNEVHTTGFITLSN